MKANICVKKEKKALSTLFLRNLSSRENHLQVCQVNQLTRESNHLERIHPKDLIP